MPVIRFIKPTPEIFIPRGTNLMRCLLSAGLPVASSCHGEGICGKCRIRIVDGAINLSPENSTEVALKDRLRIGNDERLSCQTEVLGDICVDTRYW